MIECGQSKFVRDKDGAWYNADYILDLFVRARKNSEDKYHIIFNICYNNHIGERVLEVKPEQENWSREEWQEYLDEFMYDQGLCNGKG